MSLGKDAVNENYIVKSLVMRNIIKQKIVAVTITTNWSVKVTITNYVIGTFSRVWKYLNDSEKN